MLYSTDEYITDPILAAVGQLQFEVVQYRMKVRAQLLLLMLLCLLTPHRLACGGHYISKHNGLMQLYMSALVWHAADCTVTMDLMQLRVGHASW